MGSVGQPTMGFFPFVAVKASVGAVTRANDNAALGMGYMYPDTAQNNEWTIDDWMDSVTYKIAILYRAGGSTGIATFQFDGVSVGTVDTYNAATSNNNYAEITGISVTSASAKTVKMIQATKHASSTGYAVVLHSFARIKTSGTHSTPSGTDTPGYTWEWIPWMGHKSDVGGVTRGLDSAMLGGGRAYTADAVNSEMATDFWKDTGTFKIASAHQTFSNSAIATYKFGSTSVGTIDHYSAGTVNNVYAEITGIAIATAAVDTFSMVAATKHASSTGYFLAHHSKKVIRTGA